MTRIIVIEPETRARHALRSMLEGAGYQVELAADGEDGLARHQSQPADLIIADLDDVEDKAEAFGGARFIATPGGSSRIEVGRFATASCLPKPFRRDALLKAVKTSLDS